MGKQKAPRALPSNQAQAVLRNLRVSPRKLNEVAKVIRNQTAEKALDTLTFSRRRIAQTVKKVLESAIANAENNHQLDVDRLVVRRAEVGKALVMKRFHARARGRAGGIQKFFSHLMIVVEEVPEGQDLVKAPRGSKKSPATSSDSTEKKAA
ncbi:50S ribosomal protein L22 [Acetobacteraceae bacterium]|nr:50S ribosomal protein L22 [Acetobacteraceae bacterium]